MDFNKLSWQDFVPGYVPEITAIHGQQPKSDKNFVQKNQNVMLYRIGAQHVAL